MLYRNFDITHFSKGETMTALTPTLLHAHYTHHKKQYVPSHVFPSREVSSYELTYFLPESDCKLVIDGQNYNITGDSVVFRRPGQTNQSFMPYESILIGFTFDEPSSDHLDIRWNTLDSIDMSSTITTPFLQGINTVNGTLSQTNYRTLFEDLYKESLLQRPHAHHYYAAKIMEILYALYSESGSHITVHQPTITDDTLIDLLKYIELHLTDNFTVNMISSDTAVSERHIYNLFKKHLHVTPVQYITEAKINYAKNLLRTSNLPVHEVAEMCGYENSTYFISLFKKTAGMTPLKYRKAPINE